MILEQYLLAVFFSCSGATVLNMHLCKYYTMQRINYYKYKPRYKTRRGKSKNKDVNREKISILRLTGETWQIRKEEKYREVVSKR